MKKILFFFILVIGISSVQAQLKKTDSGFIKKPLMNQTSVRVKEAKTAITPATASNNRQKSTSEPSPQTQPDDNTHYFITNAKVTIKTGNDSKEYPSKIQLFLFPIPAATYTQVYTLGQLNYTNHMVVGSSTELGLTPLNKQQVPWPVYYEPGYNGTSKSSNPFTSGSGNWMLADILRQGFRLLIAYHPNFALDAWEIKQVIVKLEIKKADGTPHPSLNNKTIVFNITSPPLGVPTGLALICEADNNFMPTTNYLTKDILIN